MIFDENKNWIRYSFAQPQIWNEAFSFIKGLSLHSKEKKYTLIDNIMYATITQATTRSLNEAKLEVHGDFCDLHVVIGGIEHIAVSPIDLLETISVDGDMHNDTFFYMINRKEVSTFCLTPGNFLMLFPGEGHAPLVHIDNPNSIVKKVVVKIRQDALL